MFFWGEKEDVSFFGRGMAATATHTEEEMEAAAKEEDVSLSPLPPLRI